MSLATATLAALVARVTRRVEVAGDSMRPTLVPGDRLVLVPVPRYRVGDLVGVIDPRDETRLLVKRITNRAPDGRYEVAGDNPDASTDSRHFGAVTRRQLRGRAVYRYAPPHRAGRLTRLGARHTDLRG